MYLPPDTNCLLSCFDHCIRSKNYINVIVASKHPRPQWLTMEEAVNHCTQGIGIWDFASNDQNVEPDLVMACAGETPTLEALAATSILREYFKEFGLEEKIIRVSGGGAVRTSKGRKYEIPCEWCSSLAGTYNYPGTPKEVFQRHEYCRCAVTYSTAKKRQDVWSKALWTASDEELQSRREVSTGDSKTPSERAREAANLAKQRENERIARETRVTNE